MRINKRFHRYEGEDHLYGGFNWAGVESGQTEFDGLIKCKLAHGKFGSLIIPDLLFLPEGTSWNYIQPFHFTPHLMGFYDAEALCTIWIDISCGTTVRVTFAKDGRTTELPDGSHIYSCKIRSSNDLPEHATGEARFEGKVPFIELYHHTTARNDGLIRASGYFKTSRYNIQGTTKLLKDRGYAYFTPLDCIQVDADLRLLAMERSGKLYFARDGFERPDVIFDRGWLDFPDDVLALDVYESTAADRTHAIKLWVESAAVAPQHVIAHFNGVSWFYEIASPFIHRVGAPLGVNVPFDASMRIERRPETLTLDYVVVGDGQTLAGLAAPYDEEDTTEIMKIVEVREDFMTYWQAHANTDMYSGQPVNLQEFE